MNETETQQTKIRLTPEKQVELLATITAGLLATKRFTIEPCEVPDQEQGGVTLREWSDGTAAHLPIWPGALNVTVAARFVLDDIVSGVEDRLTPREDGVEIPL
jgi:hypothetical protein